MEAKTKKKATRDYVLDPVKLDEFYARLDSIGYTHHGDASFKISLDKFWSACGSVTEHMTQLEGILAKKAKGW